MIRIRVNTINIFKYLLIIMPLVDTFNGMILRGGNAGIGPLYRVIVFFISILLLQKYNKSRRSIKLFASFVCIVVIQLMMGFYNGYEISNVLICIKLFMPIIIIDVIWEMYKKKKISTDYIYQIITSISIITPFTIIIPYILGIGYHTYDSYAGYLGFYYATNEISFVISTCILFLIVNLSDNISTKFVFLLVLNFTSVLLIGTKSAIAISGVSMLLFIWKMVFSKKKIGFLKKICFLFIVVISVSWGLHLFSSNLEAIFNRWMYGRTQYSNESIFFFLTSGRTGRLITSVESFFERSAITILFGQGLSAANFGGLYTEMDYFDLLFGAGLVGLVIIIVLYSYYLKRIKLSFWPVIIVSFTFILIFAGGHVLYAGLGGMMYSLILVYSLIYSNERQ